MQQTPETPETPETPDTPGSGLSSLSRNKEMTSSAVLFGIQYFGSDQVLLGTRQDAEVLGECLTKTLGIDQVRIYTDVTTPE